MANDLTHGITHHYLYGYVGAAIFTQCLRADSLNHGMTDTAFVNEMLHNSLSSLHLIFHEHKSFRI
jgi:hypothetical protein